MNRPTPMTVLMIIIIMVYVVGAFLLVRLGEEDSGPDCWDEVVSDGARICAR